MNEGEGKQEWTAERWGMITVLTSGHLSPAVQQLQLTLAHDRVGSTGTQVDPPAREQTKSWAETQLELSLLKKADIQQVTRLAVCSRVTNYYWRSCLHCL